MSALTAAQQGLLTVLRRQLPEGAAQGAPVTQQAARLALDVQDLWRWAKTNPAAIHEASP